MPRFIGNQAQQQAGGFALGQGLGAAGLNPIQNLFGGASALGPLGFLGGASLTAFLNAIMGGTSPEQAAMRTGRQQNRLMRGVGGQLQGGGGDRFDPLAQLQRLTMSTQAAGRLGGQNMIDPRLRGIANQFGGGVSFEEQGPGRRRFQGAQQQVASALGLNNLTALMQQRANTGRRSQFRGGGR